ncbi:hypothetical protein DFP86_10699 [Paludibacterium purpuratum]|uniref:Uncharacterized protein n=1 Tax=Paludibacterium purpuratum TaxID=1144873 RepID=A0A4R7B5L0_9NEIS|nr:hypothetical protein DFP86_10699 [Paludibacterium purpuratum]
MVGEPCADFCMGITPSGCIYLSLTAVVIMLGLHKL